MDSKKANEAYLSESCFPLKDLKEHILELKPYVFLTKGSLNIVSGKKPRLQFDVTDDKDQSRSVDLMITIKREGVKQEVFINKKSFDMTVERFKQDTALVGICLTEMCLDLESIVN